MQLKWSPPDEEGVVKYLCGEKQFSEDRVRSGLKKIIKSRSGSTQSRLDSFFSVSTTPAKRKLEETKKNTPNKRGKTGGGRGRKPK